MSAVTVNLKQFYQRRGMWLMYAFWALIGYFLIHSAIAFSRTDKTLDSAYVYLWQLVLCLFSGGFVGSMLGEGLTRPLVYMTPGYQVVLRKILLCSGLFICSLWCVVLVFLPKTLRIEPGINFIGLWGLNLLGFVLGTAFQFAGGWKLHLFWIMGPLVIWQGPGVIASLRILGDQYPWAALGVAIILGIMGWRYLGKEGWVRNFQDEKWLPFFGLIPRSRRKYAETPKPGPVSTDVDGFFIKRIKSCHPDGSMRYLWGQLYIHSGGGVNNKVELFLFLIFVFIIGMPLGYFVDDGNRSNPSLYMMLSLLISFMALLPLFSSMLLVASRKVRFLTTVFAVVCWSVWPIFLIVFLSAQSMMLEKVLPDIVWRKFELTYHVIPIKYIWMPLAFTPVIATLRITWGWKLVYFILYIVSHVPLFFFMANFLRFLSLTSFTCIYVLMIWIIFILICWLAAMRAPLIPKRT
jgi:hypothetical protein